MSPVFCRSLPVCLAVAGVRRLAAQVAGDRLSSLPELMELPELRRELECAEALLQLSEKNSMQDQLQAYHGLC